MEDNEEQFWKDDSPLSEEDSQFLDNKPKTLDPRDIFSGQTLDSIINNVQKVHQAIPKPPEALVKGVDFVYQSSPIGKLDQAVDYAADKISKGISQQDFPGSDIVGPAAGLLFAIRSPSGFAQKANVAGDIFSKLNKLRRASTKIKPKDPSNFFPPQSLQPVFVGADITRGGRIFQEGSNTDNLYKNFFEARTSGGIGFGSTKNIPFKGTTRGTLDLSGMSTSKRKTEKQNFFTNIYTAGKSKKGLEAVKYARRYIFGGKAQIGGTQRSIFQMAPHHFTIDDDLAFMAANTADAPEFVRELHKFDIYPGNHPRNFIGSYHDNTKKGWEETRRSIANLWGNNPDAPTEREIIKFLKMPAEGKNIGKGATLLEEIDMMAAVRKQGLDKKNWSEILPEGKTIKDVKISPVVLGIDHQELIHGVVDNLPSRLKLIELIKSPKWLELAPRQRAIEVAKVSRESQNVALRVNQIRLNLIKNRMNELGKSTEHWTDIQAWMAANPSEAASLSWHKLTQGTGLTVNELIQDLPKDQVKEVATIFNLDAIPKTGELLDQLNKTSSKTFKEL